MQEIFASLEAGAVLLTATRRLARAFRQSYTSWQRDQGRTTWKIPSILPLDAYVGHLWSECLAEAPENLLLLTGEQEALVWQQIIRESPEGESLLQVEATARCAMEAWDLIQSYRLPLDGRFQVTEDCAAFEGWAQEFERRCAERHWLDFSRLADIVLNRLCSGAITHPSAAYYAGFDEISPRQRALLTELAAEEIQSTPQRTVTRTRVCPAAEDEIRCAAAWTRGILEENPGASIGIVVLNLRQLRSKIERIFRDELGAADAFHISLGQSLDRYPILYSALLILEFATGIMPLTKLGVLLRSPYLRGASAERTARASLDARLRRFCTWEISLDELRRHNSPDCPILNHSLQACHETLAGIAGTRKHAEWSCFFSTLLKAIGWPGDRPPDSRDHQLMHRWTELLSQFAVLDAVAAPLSFSQAVERYRALAAGSVFQFEDIGAPVQIADHLEMAGMRFDHVWVMGLSDEALPAPAGPNPFLPISLQWQYGLPNASADREYKSGRTVFDRLISSAPEVVLSFPQMDGDRALSPSPFLTATPQTTTAPPSTWISRMLAASRLESIVDETAPPLDDEGVQRGGAALLRDMAACPFRAFASHRLGARELDRIEPGLSPSDKGKVLHQVLQLVLKELGSHSNLTTLSSGDLSALIRRHIATVLAPFGESTNIAVERTRLEKLLTNWMELIERPRPSFTVATLEEKKLIEIGGLQLEVRADRIDELPDGRHLILDYKTGDIKPRGWTGARLDEPQVPLYCISSGAPIAGAAFARIRADEIGFTGIADTPLPRYQSYTGKSGPPLMDQIDEWRRALIDLAERFRAGDARVDPKYGDKTCEFCTVVPLCRIHD